MSRIYNQLNVYLDGNMIAFYGDGEFVFSRSRGQIDVQPEGSNGLAFMKVTNREQIAAVRNFNNVLDKNGSPYGTTIEDTITALNQFLGFNTGGGGGTGDNIYNTDDVLTGPRRLGYNGNTLEFGDLIGDNDEPAFFFDPLNTLGEGKSILFKAGNIQQNNFGILSIQYDGVPLRPKIAYEDTLGNRISTSDGGIVLRYSDGANRNEVGLESAGGFLKFTSTRGVVLDVPSADTVGKVFTLTNALTKEGEFVDILPNVADEDARDIAFPTPANGQRVYNLRTNEIETYSGSTGLWLSATKKIAVDDSSLAIRRFIYINGVTSVPGVPFPFSYPTLAYPTNATNENQTFGVIVQTGAAIDATRTFVAIAVGNQHYIDYGEAILAGEYVSAKVTGLNADQGFAAGNSTTSGRAGIAVQNSGATIGKGLQVLVQLNLLAESF